MRIKNTTCVHLQLQWKNAKKEEHYKLAPGETITITDATDLNMKAVTGLEEAGWLEVNPTTLDTCEHVWNLDQKDILKPSAGIQELTRNGQDHAQKWMTRTKIIYIYKCEKCSKLKKIVESNPY